MSLAIVSNSHQQQKLIRSNGHKHKQVVMDGHPEPPTGHNPVSPNRESRHNSEEGSNSTSSNASNSRASKSVKFCEVCSDRAKSYHFGGLSCDSCKAFFRRSVHNDNYTAFHCSYDGNCNVTRTTRKGCQKCRFEKCLSIGMEKKWVMSENERNALNKQRLERREQSQSTSTNLNRNVSPVSTVPSPQVNKNKSVPLRPLQAPPKDLDYIPRVEDMLTFMSEADQRCIKEVVEYYRISYWKIPYQVSKDTIAPRSSLEIIAMFTTIIRRFAYFSKLVPEFLILRRDDQGSLLKGSVLEMCLLRGALSFDVENHRWPNTNLDFLKDCPQLKINDMKHLVSQELFEMHMSFIMKLQKLKVDEPTIMLLLLIVLFYADRSCPIEDVVLVSEAQEKYSMLLQKYVRWRYGPTGGPWLYPQLLDKLRDLRELNDRHTEYNLKLEPKEVNIIREDLSKLELDPFTNWKIVQADESRSSLGLAGSPEFPPMTPSEMPHSIPIPLRTRMTDAFLARIPSLIDDPFGPLITEAEMRLAGQIMGPSSETYLRASQDMSQYCSHIPPPQPPPQPRSQSTNDTTLPVDKSTNRIGEGGMTNEEIGNSLGVDMESDFIRNIRENLDEETRRQLRGMFGEGGSSSANVPDFVKGFYNSGQGMGGTDIIDLSKKDNPPTIVTQIPLRPPKMSNPMFSGGSMSNLHDIPELRRNSILPPNTTTVTDWS